MRVHIPIQYIFYKSKQKNQKADYEYLMYGMIYVCELSIYEYVFFFPFLISAVLV